MRDSGENDLTDKTMPNENASSMIVSALAPLMSERAILMSEAHCRALFMRVAGFAKSHQAGGFPIKTDYPAADPQAKPYQTISGEIAYIPITGVLTKNASWYDDYFGLCSAMGILNTLAAAVNDPSIKSVVYDIDSPGGYVNGTVELADATAEANKVKPVNAIVRGLCCSGAYWIASQCNSIIARREAECGNIGVYSVLQDWSKFLADIGIDLKLVTTGQFKGLGADMKVTDDYIADTRRIINGIYQQFVSAVAQGRSMEFDEAQALADGKAYLGPQAQKLNLIDNQASSFEAAIQIIQSGAVAPEENTMSQATSTDPKLKTAKQTPPPAIAKPAPAADPKAAKKEDEGKGDDAMTNEKLKETLHKTIASGNSHRDQAREAMDHCAANSEEMDDDTKSLAKQAHKALDGAAEEGKRASKKLHEAAGGDDDETPDQGGEGGDEDGEGDAKKGNAQPAIFGATDFITAFGDVGARWFLEGKAFSVCATECITKLKADHLAEITALKETHKTETDALNLKVTNLTTRLGAVDRGNPAAEFQTDPKAAPEANKGQDDRGEKQTDGDPLAAKPGLKKYAESIKQKTTANRAKKQ
jgi:signal peptide peptidase SppA